MTTIIVARNKTTVFMAADSRSTYGHGTKHVSIMPAENKILDVKGGIAGVAGAAADKWDYKKSEGLVGNWAIVSKILGEHSRRDCIYAKEDGELVFGSANNKDKNVGVIECDIFAVGSGGHLAHGFMSGSKLPLKQRILKALEFACELDPHSGGPFHIREFKIKKKKK